jgi:hypothetical protein
MEADPQLFWLGVTTGGFMTGECPWPLLEQPCGQSFDDARVGWWRRVLHLHVRAHTWFVTLRALGVPAI